MPPSPKLAATRYRQVHDEVLADPLVQEAIIAVSAIRLDAGRNLAATRESTPSHAITHVVAALVVGAKGPAGGGVTTNTIPPA